MSTATTLLGSRTGQHACEGQGSLLLGWAWERWLLLPKHNKQYESGSKTETCAPPLVPQIGSEGVRGWVKSTPLPCIGCLRTVRPQNFKEHSKFWRVSTAEGKVSRRERQADAEIKICSTAHEKKSLLITPPQLYGNPSVKKYTSKSISRASGPPESLRRQPADTHHATQASSTMEAMK